MQRVLARRNKIAAGFREAMQHPTGVANVSKRRDRSVQKLYRRSAVKEELSFYNRCISEQRE